jgi:hypothetical protein
VALASVTKKIEKKIAKFFGKSSQTSSKNKIRQIPAKK